MFILIYCLFKFNSNLFKILTLILVKFNWENLQLKRNYSVYLSNEKEIIKKKKNGRFLSFSKNKEETGQHQAATAHSVSASISDKSWLSPP